LATLEIEHEDFVYEDGRRARVVHVRGSVDTATVGQLDTALSECLGESGCLAALDMAETSYINSTGMLILIKHHDALRAGGGSLVLAAVPEVIAETFRTMGLLATFVLEPSVESAFDRLGSTEVAEVAGGAGGAGGAGAAVTFPLRFSCDSCVAALVADAPGKYRCPRCQACFEVASGAEVIAFPVRSAQSVEVCFPCQPSYVDVARAAAASAAKSLEVASFSAEALDRAVDEAIGIFAGKAPDADKRIRMFVAADSREFTVAFLSTDPELAVTKEDEEGLTFRSLRGIVDELEVTELVPEGQVLKLVKRFDY
jgi:anti-anti-sigma factor